MSFKGKLDGGFKHVLFSSLFGEDEPILTSIFFKWAVQPPTSNPNSLQTKEEFTQCHAACYRGANRVLHLAYRNGKLLGCCSSTLQPPWTPRTGQIWSVGFLVVDDKASTPPQTLTLPETNSSPLKMVVSNRNILFQGSIFRGYVSFREGI